MIRASWAISIGALLIVAVGADAQDGRLQHVRDEARPSSSSDSKASAGKSDDNDSVLGAFLGGILSVQDGEGNSFGGLVLTYAFIAPFYLPAKMLGDEYKFRLFFSQRPYANGYHGYQILAPEMAAMFYTTDTSDVPRREWSMRLAIENGNDFAGLNRLNGQFRIDHESRFGVTTNWNYFHERLPCGCSDETLIGDTNLTFRFAQNEVASLYAGLGFRMLSDRRQTDFGFNFTYGGDWFPIRPLVVSGVFDAGTLGSAGVIHARGSVGAIWQGWELFAGYDFLRIGCTNLQGPMAGVRWWF